MTAPRARPASEVVQRILVQLTPAGVKNDIKQQSLAWALLGGRWESRLDVVICIASTCPPQQHHLLTWRLLNLLLLVAELRLLRDSASQRDYPRESGLTSQEVGSLYLATHHEYNPDSAEDVLRMEAIVSLTDDAIET
ncbi:hypothetical protein EYF80_021851 [Liparis tanakae]|uniref:Uncharacterized protein n=1 Tax=Liparis tanakae TaxID=230148 RepID=A0A4Z2HSR5_9TELE|nr:hypothetical protein EYF80_021851 [Liparis tanakae]